MYYRIKPFYRWFYLHKPFPKRVVQNYFLFSSSCRQTFMQTSIKAESMFLLHKNLYSKCAPYNSCMDSSITLLHSQSPNCVQAYISRAVSFVSLDIGFGDIVELNKQDWSTLIATTFLQSMIEICVCLFEYHFHHLKAKASTLRHWIRGYSIECDRKMAHQIWT